MMKILRNFVFINLLFVSFFLAACSSNAPTETNTSNANIANARMPITSPSVAVANQTAPTPIVSPTVQVSADSGAPCAVVTAYHAALVRKDEAALRKTLTAATVRQYEADAKADGEKTIVGYLTAYSSPAAQPPVCGGAVQGEIANLQVKDSDTNVVSNWKAVKENGEWKLDLLSVLR